MRFIVWVNQTDFTDAGKYCDSWWSLIISVNTFCSLKTLRKKTPEISKSSVMIVIWELKDKNPSKASVISSS